MKGQLYKYGQPTLVVMIAAIAVSVVVTFQVSEAVARGENVPVLDVVITSYEPLLILLAIAAVLIVTIYILSRGLKNEAE